MRSQDTIAAPLNLNAVYQRIEGCSTQSWQMVLLPIASVSSYGREDHLREVVGSQV